MMSVPVPDISVPPFGRMAARSCWWLPGLTEGERVGLGAGVEERDLEGSLGDALALADELVQALLGEGAVAVFVEVEPVGGVRRLPVEEHLESHGGARYGRPQDHVQVAGLEAAGDLAAGPL